MAPLRTCCQCSIYHQHQNKIIFNRLIWEGRHIEAILQVTGNSKNLCFYGPLEKIFLLKIISGFYHDSPRQDNFYCYKKQHWAVISAGSYLEPTQLYFYEYKVERIFLPKFYHDKRDINILKFLSYVGEYTSDNSTLRISTNWKKILRV